MVTKQNFHKGPASTAIRQGGFIPIGRLLKNTAREYHLENAFYRHKVLQCWQKVISGFVEEAQSQTQAVDFNRGVLTVACLSRETAYKIKLMAERIITALNEVLGQRAVYAIYVEM